MSRRRRHRLLPALQATGLIVAVGLTAPSPASSLPGAAPTAKFTASPQPAVVDQTVSFDASGSTGDGFGGAIARYEWDLDGSPGFELDTGTTPTTSRSYGAPATITAGLKVTDTEGDTDVDLVSFDVRAAPAAFTFSPSTPLSNEAVSFDGSASTPPPGESITSMTWDLDGDGAFDDASGPTTSSSYPTPGPRTVRLRVDDSGGGFNTTSRVVPVGNRAPSASFRLSRKSPRAGGAVELTSTSADPDGPIANQSWDLDGDGQFDDAAGPVVKKRFRRAGTYTVGLQVVDAGGASQARTKTIAVRARKLELFTPFPVVRLAGSVRSSGKTEIERLSVRARKGAHVTVRCDGRRCPFDERERAVRRNRVKFPGMERRLEPGTVIEVFVTDPDRIGKFTRFKLRYAKAPKRRDRCVKGERLKPVRCPRS